jgi:hypothetical protein
MQHLSEERRARMRRYFVRAEPAEIAAALREELDAFAEDAREAADAWSIAYPIALEQSVRSHLRAMDLTVGENIP